MTRRAITSDACILCRRKVPGASFEERQQLAAHRMEHQRADHNRARWRAAKRRKATPPDQRAVGYLHNLGCNGGHYTRYGDCKPIAVYRVRVA